MVPMYGRKKHFVGYLARSMFIMIPIKDFKSSFMKPLLYITRTTLFHSLQIRSSTNIYKNFNIAFLSVSVPLMLCCEVGTVYVIKIHFVNVPIFHYLPLEASLALQIPFRVYCSYSQYAICGSNHPDLVMRNISISFLPYRI